MSCELRAGYELPASMGPLPAQVYLLAHVEGDIGEAVVRGALEHGGLVGPAAGQLPPHRCARVLAGCWMGWYISCASPCVPAGCCLCMCCFAPGCGLYLYSRMRQTASWTCACRCGRPQAVHVAVYGVGSPSNCSPVA
jgi:hypothetical protein